MEKVNLTVWRVVEAAAVLLVLGFLLFGLRSVLNPLLLFLLLWALLLPFRGTPGQGALLWTAGALTLVWILSTTGSVLAPFVLALVLAYVLDPVVDLFERRGVPRAATIGALALVLLLATAGALIVVIPAATAQVQDIIRQAPIFFQRVAGWVEAAQERLLRADLPFLEEEKLVSRLRGVDGAAVVAFLEQRWALLGQRAWVGVLGLGRGLSSLLTVGGYVVLTPVLAFYLLRDWDRIVATLRALLPTGSRQDVVDFATEYDHLLSRYLRGQITVAIIIGVLTAAGLWIARFPYAGTLGLMVAVFSVVPYLGLLLSLLPAVFIALVSGSVGLSLLKILVVYGVVQGLEGTVISPRIVGESVGLHPVWVVLALALGGFLFGFVGLLIGVPGAVGVKLLIMRALSRYHESALYRGAPDVPSG